MTAKSSIVDMIIAKYGIPERLHVDNGRGFTSKAFRDGLADLGIELQVSSPYSAMAKRLERHFVDLTEVHIDEPGER